MYIPQVLSASIGCEAAVNYLNLFKKLFNYRAVDPLLAEAALTVLRRHSWYLTPEMIAFCLFTAKLSDNEKSKMANHLLSYKPNIPEFYKLKEHVLPVVSEETELLDLVSPCSFKFFTILNMDYKWLEIDPELWDSDKNFLSARDFVKTISHK